MRNRTYGGVRGRKTKVGRKLLRFPPTRFYATDSGLHSGICRIIVFFVATISDKNHRKVWNELEKRRNFAPEIKKQFINLEI